jgi:hypothetical protein
VELVAQSENIVREGDLAVERTGETERGAGGDVVNQLQHGAPLVGGNARLPNFLHHGDVRRQIAGRHVLRRVRRARRAGAVRN